MVWLRPFFSLFSQPLRRTVNSRDTALQRDAALRWIETPIDEKDGGPPHLYRHVDATSIELFFDLFFVANLSTFTGTHEINNVEALSAYIGFLGIIWFTWLQVTLFDIRFARDSVFERGCKAAQLAVMVGFASAGTRFTTRIREENVWAFRSISMLLAASRLLLALQYTVNILFVRRKMKPAAKGLSTIAAILFASSLVYLGMYYAFKVGNQIYSHIWTVWFALFGLEMWLVMAVSCVTPGIGFEDTHLNVRMGLLTLIIIGEGVISVTRIVNKTVRPGGWTKWSFVHILGVTTNVYFLWLAYYDLSPRKRLAKFSQQLWAQLHYPFHVVLILLLEGSQILALTLDITLKLTYLSETILFACEEPRPDAAAALRLLNSTIADMEIDYGRGGALKEQAAIVRLVEALSTGPLCPIGADIVNDLMGNVTAALFSSMGIAPSENVGSLNSEQLLMMYMKIMTFVYVYFFVVATLAMCFFAAFVLLGGRHAIMRHLKVAFGIRILLAVFLASLSMTSHYPVAHSFMRSPAILYAFTFVLLTVMLADRLLDSRAARP